MACMRNGGPWADCPDRAFQPCVETLLARLTGVELEHPVARLPSPRLHGRGTEAAGTGVPLTACITTHGSQ